MTVCPNCQTRPKQKHWNAKWCRLCADAFRRSPRHTLTPHQIREVRRRLWKMPKGQICKEVGISWSSLGRWARDEGVRVAYFNRWKANPKLVKQVCEYYSNYGKAKTLERFHGINLRSIIERYGHALRQTRWTDDQLKGLARMAGIISFTSQYKYFNRPNAHEGSIKSAWVKRFGHGSMNINGLSWWIARHYVRPSCPRIQTKFWERKDGKRRTCVLWVDFERNLKASTPEWLRDAGSAMAGFQRWLHGTRNVRATIRKMIREVEV